MYGVAAGEVHGEVVSKEAVSDLRDRSGAGVERRPCIAFAVCVMPVTEST